jgi:hypothetical protein
MVTPARQDFLFTDDEDEESDREEMTSPIKNVKDFKSVLMSLPLLKKKKAANVKRNI